MKCFDGLLGISLKCGEKESPKSQLFFDMLPGMGIIQADATITQEYESGKQLLEEKREYAVNYVLNRLRGVLLPKTKVFSSLDSDVLGFQRNNFKTVAGESGYYKGIRVRIYEYGYLEFLIKAISLQLTTSGAKQIKIFNLYTGQQIGSDIDITAVASTPVKVTIDESFFTNKQPLDIIIVYDSVDGHVYNVIHRSLIDCDACNYKTSFGYFSGIKILKTADKVEANLISADGASGMSIEYAINCSLDSYICGMGNMLAWAILHKWGLEVIREMTLTTRFNTIVTVKSKDYKAMAKIFEDEFEESFTEIAENIVLPNDICFLCDSRGKWGVEIP